MLRLGRCSTRHRGVAWANASQSLQRGTLLSSHVTEDNARTQNALLLKRCFFDHVEDYGLEGLKLAHVTRARSRIEPKNILPSKPGQVRVITNTTRDAQQSNCSAELADEHRQQITKYIDSCFQPHKGRYPGYEQIWGGTIPMFDLWKRGVQPFDALRRQVQMLPNTPTSMLFRSSAINSMKNQPRDVIESFVQHAYDCGIDVFTNFDAHNDWRNHEIVAEAVHRAGGHYQAALSWATWQADPSVYNVASAVDFFRVCANQLGAHSLYIKDPSGVLTPAMAGMLSKSVKEAFPDLPLVFHTHYQSGYSYMSYLQAVQNGANGIECSAGFSDGAGQPYAGTMLKALADLGYDVGYDGNIDAPLEVIERINQLCKEIRPLYVRFPQNLLERGATSAKELANAAASSLLRTPDLSVERSGIAGGQRTILDRELIDCGQSNLIPQVDSEVSMVRGLGGKVCQVTPVADSYAREALRLLRSGRLTSDVIIENSPSTKPQNSLAEIDGVVSEEILTKIGKLSDGYVSILIGEGGWLPDPVHAPLRFAALVQRGRQFVNSFGSQERTLGDESKAKLLENAVAKLEETVPTITGIMLRFAEPWLLRERLTNVVARLDQLERLKNDPAQFDALRLQFEFASKRFAEGTEDYMKLSKLNLSTGGVPSGKAVVYTVEDRINELKREEKGLNDAITKLLGSAAGKLIQKQAFDETKRGMKHQEAEMKVAEDLTSECRLTASAEIGYRIALFDGDVNRYIRSYTPLPLSSKDGSNHALEHCGRFEGTTQAEAEAAASSIFEAVGKALPDEVKIAIDEKLLSKQDIWSLISRCSMITAMVRHVDLLEPGINRAEVALQKLEETELLGLSDDAQVFKDLVILQACFSETAIPDLYYNFLRNYRENPRAFANIYLGQDRLKAIALSDESQAPELPSQKQVLEKVPVRLEWHRQVLTALKRNAHAKQTVAGSYDESSYKPSLETIFNDCVALKRDLLALQTRLARQSVIKSRLTAKSQVFGESKDDLPPLPITPLSDETLGQISSRANALTLQLEMKLNELAIALSHDVLLWKAIGQRGESREAVALNLLNEIVIMQVASRLK